MTLTIWLACGLSSCITFVLFIDRDVIRNFEFVECVFLTTILAVLLAMGPIGLAFTLIASLIYGVSRFL